MTNVLFVCSENKLRIATAECVFQDHDLIDAIGAGTNHESPTPVSGDIIEWAEIILAMEAQHRNKINRKYSELLKGKKIAVLEISDSYEYMQSELIWLFTSKRRQTP